MGGSEAGLPAADDEGVIVGHEDPRVLGNVVRVRGSASVDLHGRRIAGGRSRVLPDGALSDDEASVRAEDLAFVDHIGPDLAA